MHANVKTQKKEKKGGSLKSAVTPTYGVVLVAVSARRIFLCEKVVQGDDPIHDMCTSHASLANE